MPRRMLTLVLSLSVCLCGASIAIADDEKPAETGFEGWDSEKPAEAGAAKSEEKPAEKPAEKPKAPEVGAGANAPGSHPNIVPSVSTQYGALTILGVFQTLFDNNIILKNAPTDTHYTKMSFDFQRARIILKGHLVSENLTYFFQGDARNMLSFALDMFVGYKFADSGLSFRVGRFVPEFGYMMPRNTADLAAINYPLYITNARFAVWRQIGIEAMYQKDALQLRLGVFNGLLYDQLNINPSDVYMQMGTVTIGATDYTNYSDNNKMKDFLLRVSYKPSKELSLDFSGWFGFPVNFNDADSNDFVFMGGPGFEYNNGKMHLIGEVMFRAIKYGEDNADPGSVTSLGAWLHGGYRLTDVIEGILRLDLSDPVIGKDRNDMLMRVTTGAHFWLEEKHFRILTNLFVDIPVEGENRQIPMGIQVQFAALW